MGHSIQKQVKQIVKQLKKDKNSLNTSKKKWRKA